MEVIRRRCNPIVNLSKFTSNKKIFEVNFVVKLCPKLLLALLRIMLQ